MSRRIFSAGTQAEQLEKLEKMKSKILVSILLGLSLTAACTTTAPTNNSNAGNANKPAVNGNANGNSNIVVTNANGNLNGNGNSNVSLNSNNKTSSSGHHEHTAPHGGTLIGFGEEFAHVELVLDKSTGKLTAYTLDGEAEKGVPVEQAEMEIAVKKPSAFTVKLAAVESTLTGSKKGAATEFSGTADQLKNLDNFDAEITNITIKGKSFKSTAFNFPKGNENH